MSRSIAIVVMTVCGARLALAQDSPEPAPPPTDGAPPASEHQEPPQPAGVEPAAPAPEPASEDEAGNQQDLAKKLTNPIADLVSIPFQFNWNAGVGVNEDLQMVLNIQPVVPVHLSKDWNLIGRYIVPLVEQPVLTPGGTPSFGIGDVAFSLFLSPAKPSKFIWGLGPIFGLPMSTDPTIGSGKWQLGPTGVALYMTGSWTLGVLINQLFSIANTGDLPRKSVSQMFVQPFVSYVTKNTVTFSLETETTINWEVSNDNRWSVPIELEVSKLTKLGPFPFSVQAGGGIFVTSPSGGPDWRLRLSFTVLLPEKKTPHKK